MDPPVQSMRDSTYWGDLECALQHLCVDLDALQPEILVSLMERRERAARLSIGRYLILRELGKGGMGVVYEAWDPKIERRVAIKTLEPARVSISERTEVVTRFLRETTIIGGLKHPSIVTVFDSGMENERGANSSGDDRIYYYVMELLLGRSLAQALKERGRLPVRKAVRICRSIASALALTHQEGVVHRDIKPSNVFLRTIGDAVLLDFGIAKSASISLTQKGHILGTPSYIAPERLAEHETPIDGRADLFSLGILLYSTISGAAPFHAESVHELMKKICQETHPRLSAIVPAARTIEPVVDRLLAKEPQDRFQDAGGLIEALDVAMRQLNDPEIESVLMSAQSSYVPDLFRDDDETECSEPALDLMRLASAVHPPTEPRSPVFELKSSSYTHPHDGEASPKDEAHSNQEETKVENIVLSSDADPDQQVRHRRDTEQSKQVPPLHKTRSLSLVLRQISLANVSIRIWGAPLDERKGRSFLTQRQVIWFGAAMLLSISFGLGAGQWLGTTTEESMSWSERAKKVSVEPLTTLSESIRSTEALLSEAEAARTTGDFVRAAQLFELAAGVEPQNAQLLGQAYLGRADALKLMGDTAEAIPMYRKAAAIAEEGAIAQHARIAIEELVKKTTDSHRTRNNNDVQGQNPSNPDKLCQKRLLDFAADPLAAVAAFEELARRHPQAACPRWHLGMKYERLGRGLEAIDAYRSYLRLSPRSSRRAAVLNRINKLKEAKDGARP